MIEKRQLFLQENPANADEMKEEHDYEDGYQNNNCYSQDPLLNAKIRG